MYKNDVLIGKFLLQMHLQLTWHLQVVSIICWRKVIVLILPILSFSYNMQLYCELNKYNPDN